MKFIPPCLLVALIALNGTARAQAKLDAPQVVLPALPSLSLKNAKTQVELDRIDADVSSAFQQYGAAVRAVDALQAKEIAGGTEAID